MKDATLFLGACIGFVACLLCMALTFVIVKGFQE